MLSLAVKSLCIAQAEGKPGLGSSLRSNVALNRVLCHCIPSCHSIPSWFLSPLTQKYFFSLQVQPDAGQCSQISYELLAVNLDA